MTENQKNLLVTLGVCIGAGAVIFGIHTRDRLDLGFARPTLAGSGALVSREDSPDIPAEQYFTRLTDLIKREYVDKVNDDMKLAAGAVRGMVGSLGDTNSVYYDEKTFPVYLNELKGQYEGIGVDLVFVREQVKSEKTGELVEGGIPKLMVSSVVPGGPADRAGVKQGYWVDSINDIWVMNPSLQDKVNEARDLVNKKKMPPESLNELREEIRTKLDTNMPPLRAREKLTTGTTGSIKVLWRTPGGTETLSIQKSTSSRPNFEQRSDGSIAIRFVPGTDKDLREALNGKTEATLDLRGVATGDYPTMRKCLEVVGGKGSYGFLSKEGEPDAIALTVKEGTESPPKLKILVDAGTQGVAEIFALALKNSGKATIEGTTGNNPVATEVIRLPVGSGYTLAIGRYNAKGESK
ncbi:MAG: hypothetical protein KF784_14690 [Fimbriimonadaceae bacterium]|nr:hypothetical protein [Fimbriimonadaceae bacterium]